VTKRSKKRIEKILGPWDDLIKSLPKLTEEELETALKTEQARPEADGGPRKEHIKRITGRLLKMRRDRERKELMAGGSNATA
jgi:hypothetical protein